METQAVGVRWHKLRALGRDIYAYGKPQVLSVEGTMMAVGTLSAEVLVFENQELARILTPPERVDGYGAVTCIAIKGKRIAVGYRSGFVALWSGPSLVFLSSPVRQPPRPNSAVNDRHTHLYGTPITTITINGDTIISGDARGLVIQHRHVRLITEQKVHTRKLLGEYTPQIPTSVLSMLLVDSMVCVLTPHHFIIYSLADPEGVIFVLKNQQQQEEPGPVSGNMAWSPELGLLGLCWGKSAQVLRLTWVPVRRQRPKFQCTAEKLWRSDQSLVKFSFFGNNHILLVDVTNEFVVLDLDTFETVHKESLLDKHIVHPDLLSESLDTIVADSFASSLIFDSAPLLILGQYELYMGSFINWADQIMAALNSPQPVSAIKLANDYYKSDLNFEIIGIGSNDRDMVAATMPDIIITLARYTLEMDQANVATVFDVCLEAIVLMDIPMIEPVYELVEPYEDEIVFLHKILKLVLEGQIKRLEPRVYKQIITFLSEKGFTTDLENVMLLLDPSTLDLNLAFNLCKELNLETVYFYLNSAILREYIKPLQSESTLKYDFLRATLCGTVYPTGQQMTIEQHNDASTQIYSTLFGNDDYVFLLSLINGDPGKMFDVLEAAFEQSYLNEENDGHMHRQYLISVLRIVCKKDLRLFYAVFVAKSVAKYPQFVVLKGTELEKVLQELTKPSKDTREYVSNENRELAVLALLSVYTLQDFGETVSLLTEAKFYLALEQLHTRKRDFKNLVKILLVHLKDSGVFMGLWSQLGIALEADHSVVGLIVMDAPLLAQSSAADFAELVIHYRLPVYDDLDRIDEEPRLALLHELTSRQPPPPKVISDHINLMAKYDGVQLMETLRTIYGKNDVQLPLVVDSLVEYHRTDALVLVMSRLGRDSEAMIYLLNHVESNSGNDKEVAKYVSLGVGLCSKVSRQDLGDGEQIWKKLLVAMSRLQLDVLPALRELVQFTLNESQAVPGAAHLATRVVTDIFNNGVNLLDKLNSVMEQQELLINVMRQIFHGMSYRDIMHLLQQRLTGWTLSIDGECEKCGAKVCGLGVDAEKLYSNWENRQRNIELPPTDALVVFRCTHVYHSRCLGATPSTKYQCIVCED